MSGLKRAGEGGEEGQQHKRAREEGSAALGAKDAGEEREEAGSGGSGGSDGSAGDSDAGDSGDSSGSEDGGSGSGQSYVGWLDTEMLGHKFRCDNGGQYRYHRSNSAYPGYYCCLDAKESAGEDLALWRNPKNRYDSNAIEVHGTGGMLGHLPKDLAARLAPLLDSGKVRLWGDGFAVGRGAPGDPFTLHVLADQAWFARQPSGHALAARWAWLEEQLDTEAPAEGEEGGCFRFPRE